MRLTLIVLVALTLAGVAAPAASAHDPYCGISSVDRVVDCGECVLDLAFYGRNHPEHTCYAD